MIEIDYNIVTEQVDENNVNEILEIDINTSHLSKNIIINLDEVNIQSTTDEHGNIKIGTGNINAQNISINVENESLTEKINLK